MSDFKNDFNKKFDTAIFVHKEVNNLHPEQADSPFQMLDSLHSCNTRSVSNNNLFISMGKTHNFQKTVIFRKQDLE